MPCRSYEDEYSDDENRRAAGRRQKEISDRLARIACISLTAIEELYALMPNDQKKGTHIGDLLNDVLTNTDVLQWWPAHKAADAAEQARLVAAAEKAVTESIRREKREELMSKMSKEDKDILGIK